MAQTSESDRLEELVGRAVEEYMQRVERGERPQLDEFAKRYPEIGEVLKSIIPAFEPTEQGLSSSGTGRAEAERPRQLGDFRILRQIGRGGMGIVYEAEHVLMQRRVALKVLPMAGLVDGLRIERFRNEVRAVASLNHPNIVPVYTVSEDRGVHYFAMQLIRGRSLAEIISSLRHLRDEGAQLEGSSISYLTSDPEQSIAADGAYSADPKGVTISSADLPGSEASAPRSNEAETVIDANDSTLSHTSRREYFRSVAALGIQAAQALQHAHDQAIIHRDIKPANLLVDGASQLYVTDFGLARIETGSGVTMTGDVVGTLRYMAPEQALGKRVVDNRADVYSLGATLYELLTLRPAYTTEDRQGLLKEIAFEEPTPLRRIDSAIPAELATIVHKAMSKEAAERYHTAKDLADDLRSHLENRPIQAKPPTLPQRINKWRRRNPVLTWATVITLALATFALSMMRDRWNERWAREQLSKVRRLTDENEFAQALDLATKIERVIPRDPTLTTMWPEFSVETSITTDPEGADIYIREWDTGDANWQHIGTSPLAPLRVPKSQLHWKVCKSDHATLVVFHNMAEIDWSNPPPDPNKTPKVLHFRLEKIGDRISPMVRVPSRESIVLLARLAHAERLSVGEYLIDRHEITNRQFQDFVDQGGYTSRRYWKQPFVKDGAELSWEDAVAHFVDATGSPGPAGWKSGRFPEGEPDYPVRGVSWYEAAAYAEFAGKRLPSVYHWARAANIWNLKNIIPVSNFGSESAAPVGRYHGVGAHGAFDMAGNVKEWCWNSAGDGRRYILGGAWHEPEYMFNYPDFQPPFARSEDFGFRCVQIADKGESSPQIDREIVAIEQRDFLAEAPISDEEFASYKQSFSYDKTPLNPSELSKHESKGYTHEKVQFDAADGDDRVTAHFYYPSDGAPPYQTIVYFPPAFALNRTSFDETVLPVHIAFFVQNGRAVLYPIYKGTYERKSKNSPQSSVPTATHQYRRHVIAWSQDLGRSIDYLETREDVDHEKLAYYGYSWGATLAPIFLSMENRIKVAILNSGGLAVETPYPIVDPVNYVRRMRTPTLMLSGQANIFYPIELAVQPMYDMLGTPEADKRLRTYEGASQYLPQQALTQETTAWLDKYLAPVFMSD